jgi:hypothetical protein
MIKLFKKALAEYRRRKTLAGKLAYLDTFVVIPLLILLIWLMI